MRSIALQPITRQQHRNHSQYKLIGTVQGSDTTSYSDYALTGYAYHYYIIAPLNKYGEGNWSDAGFLFID